MGLHHVRYAVATKAQRQPRSWSHARAGDAACSQKANPILASSGRRRRRRKKHRRWALTAGPLVFHFDLPLEDAGHGVELAGVAVGAVVAAAHGVVAALAHLLALAHGLLVLHHARGPKSALHAQARAGCAQVCRGGTRRERHRSQPAASPALPGHCAQHRMPASPASGPRLPPPSHGKRTELLALAPPQPLHPSMPPQHARLSIFPMLGRG